MAGARTPAGIARVARKLGCEVAALEAVIAVESRGNGFHPDGRPVILFEAHVFSRETQGRFDASNPALSSRNWNRSLYAGGLGEWPRFYAALQLDAEAAQRSCSWGLMQVMGFNWAACGEKSLAGFIHAMYHNEDAQIALAGEFIASRGLADELRRRDWEAFAYGYNGPAHAKNAYVPKLRAAYARAKA